MESIRKCPLCLQEKPISEFRDSHFIPRWAFRFINEVETFEKNGRKIRGHIHWISSNSGKVVPPKQDGPHLKPFFCDACEQHLNRFDDPARNIFFELKGLSNGIGITQKEWLSPDRRMTYAITNGLPYKELKLFALSLLWRCHICPLDVFAEICLPENDAEKIRRMILDENPGGADDYPVELNRAFLEGVLLETLVAAYSNTEIKTQQNIFSIYLLGFEVIVNIRQLRKKEIAEKVCLSPDLPLYIVNKNMEEFQYFTERIIQMKIVQTEEERQRGKTEIERLRRLPRIR